MITNKRLTDSGYCAPAVDTINRNALLFENGTDKLFIFEISDRFVKGGTFVCVRDIGDNGNITFNGANQKSPINTVVLPMNIFSDNFDLVRKPIYTNGTTDTWKRVINLKCTESFISKEGYAFHSGDSYDCIIPEDKRTPCTLFIYDNKSLATKVRFSSIRTHFNYKEVISRGRKK